MIYSGNRKALFIVDAAEDPLYAPEFSMGKFQRYQFDFADPILSAQKLAAKIKKLQKCHKRIDVVSAVFDSKKELTIQAGFSALRLSDRVFLSGLASYPHVYGAGAATVYKLQVKHKPIDAGMYKNYVAYGETIRIVDFNLDVNGAGKTAAGNNRCTLVSQGDADVQIGGDFIGGLKRIVDPFALRETAKSGKKLVFDEEKSTSKMAVISDNGGLIHVPVYSFFRNLPALLAARSSLNAVGIDIDVSNKVLVQPDRVALDLYIPPIW